MMNLQNQLEALKELPVQDQLQQLSQLLEANQEAPALGTSAHQLYVSAVCTIFSDTTISSAKKVGFGELLNNWGDPRIMVPSQEEYWVELDLEHYQLKVARYLVTIQEWQAFLADGYDDNENWSEGGLVWKGQKRPSWKTLAAAADSQKYMYQNQPAVGICWYEALAYAKAHGARLMSFSERLLIARGKEKRPYPWGDPFGYGNSNTQEEGLNKPCAVGLYTSDCTPEGVFDLAGNVAEWTEDEDESRRVIHPGSWNMDSMGSWNKASQLYSAAARTGYLGFRLVRDL